VNAIVLVRTTLIMEGDYVRGLVDRFGPQAVVRQHELVAAEFVLVPVMESKRFPAPMQVVVVGLVVLVGDGELRILASQANAPFSLPVVLKGFRRDLTYGLVVERHACLA